MINLESSVQFWEPQYKIDTKQSEGIQRRTRKVVKGLKGKAL